MAQRRSLGIFSGLGGPWARGLLVVLIVLSVVFLVLDRARPGQSPFDPIKRMVADDSRSLMTLLSAPLRTLNQFSAVLASNWQTSSRVRALEQDNQNLMRWRDLALALHEKISRYEELLGAPKTPTPIIITARAITDAGGPFVRARLINVGGEDGVAEGQAVLAYNGLIGRVMDVGKKASRVLLLTDLNSRIPVYIADIGAHAILAGDNSGTPKLIYIERGALVEAGMRIMTSGEDGVLPRGLAVGEVARAGRKEWRVSLFARPERVDYVSVLKIPAIRFEKISPDDAGDVQGAASEPTDTLVTVPEKTTSQAGAGDE